MCAVLPFHDPCNKAPLHQVSRFRSQQRMRGATSEYTHKHTHTDVLGLPRGETGEKIITNASWPEEQALQALSLLCGYSALTLKVTNPSSWSSRRVKYSKSAERN